MIKLSYFKTEDDETIYHVFRVDKDRETKIIPAVISKQDKQDLSNYIVDIINDINAFLA